ncbi:MAG TPA: ketoacyl-ACP synthase III [Terrimesophilobacter sp.]|nr:ketoacyl-ACP synthase III [Terrimesophilobacter sp.]
MKARISAVEYFLPEQTLTNEDLSAQFPEWSVEKIAGKTGINVRHIAAPDEFSSDLATGAARRLFDARHIDPQSIDYLILVTQSPDYYLPTTATIVHDQLQLRTDAGATDVSLGCSGYIYALGLAKGLIESEQVGTVLVLTADTYTKFLNAEDKSVRTIFGDGASATLVTSDGNEDSLGAFRYGTDGSGGRHLIVPAGGLRSAGEFAPKADPERRGLAPSSHDLYMDGAEIFTFTIRVAQPSVNAILKTSGLGMEDIDLFVFHQANKYMLEHLREKLGIPAEKFPILMENYGNTVSSTIPMALTDAERMGLLQPGMRVLLLGFGVGLSWGGAVVTW